ncbi:MULTISPECIES: macrolide family glycosyltransferase [unclassified Thermoactinomyces]|uniref:macrolide family glycosyltransferase n=1 Tax=unclassified Thermoactinomyces TaxID=2634588 RepID=UPI0018DDA0A6|nr:MULTISPECIES: macrolide family glycosyltransferase [unclassified Thermoactinomyces]MBH8599153.1 glycosyl transferase [Thermoactinomyces sp. CICC 10523]MBH8609161.1 glycosyl transferase [Thermoactinomyces sp. CICC 10521]
MSTVLFLNGPSHGHVNPTLGLVAELSNRGEKVIYFCTDDFREKIARTGAIFKSLGDGAKLPKGNPRIDKNKQLFDIALRMLLSTEKVVQHILEEIKEETIDYMIYDSMYPVGNIISQILKVPVICSHAVFARPEELAPQNENTVGMEVMQDHPALGEYRKMVNRLKENYGVEMPQLTGMITHYGDLNIAYTAKEFVTRHEDYDPSFRFIGGPESVLEEKIDFPFDRLEGKKVVFISLGTAFNNANPNLYDVFFNAFKEDLETVVVIAAYNTDVSRFAIPDNFIVRHYVPQREILKYTDVAVTHGGLNTTSDLVYQQIPFVVIPIGGDQPYMAGRFASLGASITLDKDTLTPEILRQALDLVSTAPEYRVNLGKIKRWFEEAGGCKKAVEEIMAFKKERNIG